MKILITEITGKAVKEINTDEVKDVNATRTSWNTYLVTMEMKTGKNDNFETDCISGVKALLSVIKTRNKMASVHA